MSGDQLDLDGIEERHGKYATEQECGPCYWDNPHDCTALALVAEVRRLRAGLTRLARILETEDDVSQEWAASVILQTVAEVGR